MSLLKFYSYKFELGEDFGIMSPEGQVPFTALQFAISRCNDYIAIQKHLDLDTELAKVWDHEWDQFLSNYYIVLHKNGKFLESKEFDPTLLNLNAKNTLKEISKYWPQYHLDGMKNIWILKPGNKCRGRGIQLVRTVEDVSKIMNLKLKYVVQKYIGIYYIFLNFNLINIDF